MKSLSEIRVFLVRREQIRGFGRLEQPVHILDIQAPFYRSLPGCQLLGKQRLVDHIQLVSTDKRIVLEKGVFVSLDRHLHVIKILSALHIIVDIGIYEKIADNMRFTFPYDYEELRFGRCGRLEHPM
ncbi:hypothetical protein [uncultured Alistipes sp.]|uniref:hypothetical protein n=1 Tax=uncultured Alistipes sp. TaxID=538949 RepID=UPI0025EC65C4|nr:hypothetical protein [uncultured Alistipes sp.]